MLQPQIGPAITLFQCPRPCLLSGSQDAFQTSPCPGSGFRKREAPTLVPTATTAHLSPNPTHSQSQPPVPPSKPQPAPDISHLGTGHRFLMCSQPWPATHLYTPIYLFPHLPNGCFIICNSDCRATQVPSPHGTAKYFLCPRKPDARRPHRCLGSMLHPFRRLPGLAGWVSPLRTAAPILSGVSDPGTVTCHFCLPSIFPSSQVLWFAESCLHPPKPVGRTYEPKHCGVKAD